MDISNRTLAIFLLAAIVVSLAGTMVSLQKLGQVSTTGFATSGTGNVSINVQSSLSITTADSNTINFGSCTPLGVYSRITSENLTTDNTSQVCPSFAANNISVRNDGNVNANVTVRPNKVGNAQSGTFLASSSAGSAIAYKTEGFGRGAYSGGCTNTSHLVANYVNFSSTTDNVTACTNLTYGATNNSFLTEIAIVMPNDVVAGQQDVILTYVAWTT